MPSPTDFNLSPYYDDFNETKKFHKVLFRPAFAVQGRELTQSQSILQNQIERISDHVFEEGAMVIPGDISYDLNYHAVKLTSFTDSASVGITLADFIGLTLTGASSGVIARVVGVSATDGTDPNTLFVKYLNSGSNFTTNAFTNSETISGTTTISGTVTTASAVVTSTATGSLASIKEGVYYINGYHVSVTNQELILEKYSNTPSYRVGLLVVESFITQNDDASLNDNAQGVSNTNAPGAHRFKIDLTLTKKSLTDTDDTNFVELLRLKNGFIQNQVRTTEYAVLEETLARRTFDESGDYTVREFDLDLREHLISGTNRGIYSAGDGGVETKVAAGMGPGKAYVRGFEIETLGTSFIDVNKARDFDTQNNNNVVFDVGNYVNVNNVYGTPDIGFVSGDVEAFKNVNLYKTATAPVGFVGATARGTENTGSGSNVNQIGRAKSKGFEYSSGTAVSGVYASSAATTNVFKHYLFDVVMFTHLNIAKDQAFTQGEEITGSTSGAKGTVDISSTNNSFVITNATAANPVVISSTNTLQDGQQVIINSVVGMTELNGNTYTVKNPTSSTFQLDVDGSGFTAYTSGGTADHSVLVLYNVSGTFVEGETITGGTSSNTATIQADARGFKGVTSYDFSFTKQIGMDAVAPIPKYTADTILDATNGESLEITGTVSIANSSNLVTGFGTKFNRELRIGDSVSITTDAGSSVTKIIEAITSDTSLEFTSNVESSDVSTKSNATRNRAKLNDVNKNISIFRLPFATVKTLKTTSNSGASDTNFKVRRHFTTTLGGNGDATITAGTNELFSSLSNSDFSVSIMELGAGATGAVGNFLALNGVNHESNTIFTLSGSPVGKSLILDFGANYSGHKIKILATVTRSVVEEKTKTLNSNSTIAISDQTTIESGTIGLAKADIYEINSIFMSPDFSTVATTSHTDVTNRFTLDNGQRDNFYDIGRIKLKTGEIAPTGRLLINFDYLSHGSGDVFTVDSYSGALDYEDIPSHTSDTTGIVYELRDCLDFRPRVDDDSTINSGDIDRFYNGSGASTVDVAKIGADIISDLEYYLPRIDKIFLDKDGQFKVLEGASALIPQAPKNLDGAMHLYTLDVPSYTFDTSDIDITRVDNKRYTMRDIGRLENRIQNIEYYTQLSLLEMQAQSLQVQDAEGFDRFKNGFIVDNFTGHSIGDVRNLDYKASVDMAKGELRPMFNEDAVQLIESDNDGSTITSADRVDANYAKTGDLITLPYTEATLIDQPFASRFENVNPFDIFSWVGSVTLTPPSDEWKETERTPELVVNRIGGFDTLVQNLGNPNLQNVEIGTVWNEWQEFWSGTPTVNENRSSKLMRGRAIIRANDITETGEIGITRTGIRSRIVPNVIRNSIGDRIVSVGIVPFLRSRTLTFSATRLKPQTRVYPFFDNIDIISYVTPTGGALGDNLVTDINGAISGTFTIPDSKVNANPRWRTGQRVFRLTSSSTNASSTAVETSAEADYSAKGALETVQETIISTREPLVVRESTIETSSRGTQTRTRRTETIIGWSDPLSQTFMIDDIGGVFVTSIDLFFSSKDTNIPVTVQIREVVNGYPGKRIVPFSEKTLNPASVSTSTDATTATTFTFDSPVYLLENTEYCFVIMSMCNNYNCYVGRLGERVLGSDRTISQQPYAGVMFKSQNGSTWTAEQNEDIKFKIKRAEFSNVTGTVTLCNDNLPTRTLKENAIRTTNGSGVITISHPNHGMHGTSNNVTIAGIPAGTYNGIDTSIDPINGTYTSISNITLDSYDITTTGTATATGDIGGTAITATQNRLYDVLNLNLQTVSVPGTNISYNIRPTTGKSVHGSESEFSLTSVNDEISVIANDNIHFTSPKMVASVINEANEMSSNKSLFVNITFTTTNTKVSPVLDLQRVSAYVIQNKINNPTSGNTPNYVSDIVSSGTSAAAVYITKPVELENLSTALDIRLTQNVRSTSSVKLYFRLSSSEESRNITEIGWTPFNVDGEEDVTVTPSINDSTFKEYKFSASQLNEFNTFQLKIVMLGTNSAYPPRIKDLRGIALAV